MSRTEQATFGAGCFWGVQHFFDLLPGVISTRVGYMGGKIEDPVYKEVCTDTTGHAEVVNVVFDPDVVSYADVVNEFWRIHDPTTLNRQGPDFGSQYRSEIFTYSDEQARIAQESKEAIQHRFSRPIVTKITPASTFWKGEDYHQKYFEKRGSANCHRPNW